MNTISLELYGTTFELDLSKDEYASNKRLAVCATEVSGDPFAVITVNLPGAPCEPGQAYVDINNCPWAPELLRKYSIATPTGDVALSGFCEYPLYNFDLTKF